MNDSSGFCWDDMELGRKEVLQCVGMLESAYGINRKRLMIAGASQGARLAFETAHEIGAPYVCVVPSFPPEYAACVRARAAKPVPGLFILGELDRANERARPVMDAQKEAGAWVRVRVMKGVGHDIPENFTDLIAYDLEELHDKIND